MREVERLTAYQPPRSLAYRSAGASMSAYPVSLSFVPGDTAIVANVVFVGDDFSHRFGNYFAHALASPTAESDLGPLVPIELWQASVWHDSPIDSPVESLELDPLSGPLERGTIDRASVQTFVKASRSAHVLPALLSAAARAVTARERRVLLVEADAAGSASWIAALWYLLPATLAWQMSFTTYHHRPSHCGLRVVGTVPDADVDSSDDALASFYLYDFVGDRFSEVEVHPLAELLSRVGVVAAERLWQLSTSLSVRSGGEETTLDDWYPVVALACAASGQPLSGHELDLAVDWLTAWARGLDAATVTSLGMAVLDQPAFDDRHRSGLITAASAAGASSLKERLDDMECELVDRQLARLVDGGRRGVTPVRLTSVKAEGHARKSCEERLAHGDLAAGLKLLDWAMTAEVRIGDPALVGWGERVLGPVLLRDASDREARRAVVTSPGTLHGVAGFLDGVAARDPETVTAALRGKLGDLVGEEHAGGRPRLHELVLLEQARRSPSARVNAFTQILELRGAHTVDHALLERLWPERHWSFEDARQIVERLDHDQALSGAVSDWLTATLSHAPRTDGPALDKYVTLCLRIRERGIAEALPEQGAHYVHWTVWARDHLSAAARYPRSRAAVEAALTLARELGDAAAPAQTLVLRRLPEILLRELPGDGLAEVIAECPKPVVHRYLTLVTAALGQHNPDTELGARLFTATLQLCQRGHPYGPLLERQGLGLTLPAWRRRDVDRLAKLLKRQDRDLGERFRLWGEERSGAARHASRKRRGNGRARRGRLKTATRRVSGWLGKRLRRGG